MVQASETLQAVRSYSCTAILIAEDDEMICQIVSNALADDGHAVNAAADGEQAWEALRHDAYDLLVADNEMPRLTGIKLIERIRKAGNESASHCCFRRFLRREHARPSAASIEAVIPKPLANQKFLDIVRNVLSFE